METSLNNQEILEILSASIFIDEGKGADWRFNIS